MESKKWGIVGGGIMGMTLAHRLAQQGHSVTIFEVGSRTWWPGKLLENGRCGMG